MENRTNIWVTDVVSHSTRAHVKSSIGRRQPEHPVRHGTTRMDDPLGDPLVIEMHDLLAQMKIIQERRPARAYPQAVVRVVHGHSRRRGQRLTPLCPRGRYGLRRHPCCSGGLDRRTPNPDESTIRPLPLCLAVPTSGTRWIYPPSPSSTGPARLIRPGRASPRRSARRRRRFSLGSVLGLAIERVCPITRGQRRRVAGAAPPATIAI